MPESPEAPRTRPRFVRFATRIDSLRTNLGARAICIKYGQIKSSVTISTFDILYIILANMFNHTQPYRVLRNHINSCQYCNSAIRARRVPASQLPPLYGMAHFDANRRVCEERDGGDTARIYLADVHIVVIIGRGRADFPVIGGKTHCVSPERSPGRHRR